MTYTSQVPYVCVCACVRVRVCVYEDPMPAPDAFILKSLSTVPLYIKCIRAQTFQNVCMKHPMPAPAAPRAGHENCSRRC